MTTEKSDFACQKCGEVARGADETALRVKGWRIWSGQTISGGTSTVVLCVSCVSPDSPQAGWHAECLTCGEETDEEYADGEVLTKADCERWQRYHDCQPEVVIERAHAAVAS